MNKVDSFFKKKVEQMTLEPRPVVWSRLEGNLPKKNNLWMLSRLAAVIVLIGVLISSIILLKPDQENQQRAHRLKKISPTDSLRIKDEPKVDKGSVALQSTKPSTSRKKERAQGQSQIQTVSRKAGVESIPVQDAVDAAIETQPSFASEDKTTVLTPAEKPIVIEYTLEPIVNTAPEQQVVAVSADKKNNLAKAIEFARQAKNSDGTLGGLRQAKDDLFALNFKKDKQKN